MNDPTTALLKDISRSLKEGNDIEKAKLKELRTVKYELQNIRVILESVYVKDYEVVHERDENGHVIGRTRNTLEDALGQLRKRYNIDP